MDAGIDERRRLEIPTDRNLRGRSDARAQAIIDDINAGLAKGTLKIGDRLPDERSLCERYGAGRHTVRKALDLLVSQGVVARYVGRGSYITASPENTVVGEPLEQVRDWSLLELTEARLLLEPGIAALVMERADAADFRRLKLCIGAVEQARNWREFKESKYAFHRALALAARNSFIVHFFDLIITTRRNKWEGDYYHVQDIFEARAICLEECRAILSALEAADANGATDAIRRSITRIMVMASAL